jgi:hypothetical protein
MKLVRYPATTVIIKLFCDCGKGEMIYQSSSEAGHLHKCNNGECGIEHTLSQSFPTTRAEILNVNVEEVEIQKEVKTEEVQELQEDLK